MADTQRVALNLKADILYARRRIQECCLDDRCEITQFWIQRCDQLLDSLSEMSKGSESPTN